MLIDVKVPHFAESITEGTLLEWRKKPGEAVQQDEILIEIETDKVVLEVPAPKAGVLKEIVKDDGATVLSDELIARVDTDGAAAKLAEKPAARKKPEAVRTPEPEKETPKAAPAPVPAGDEQSPLSPAVRKLVAEHGLEPAEITGTGKGGRITKEDVLAHLERSEQAAPPAPAEPAPMPAPAPAETPPQPAARPRGERAERRVPMTRIRARIAERLVQAQHTAAILTTFNEIDMHPVLELRSRYKERFEKAHGVRLGIMSFFTKAVVQALQKFPAVNASIDANDIVYHEFYDIGIAVGSPRGLVVPVLKDADALSFAEIERKITEFGEKAKGGQLTVEELSGGTFTITNGGVFGSLLSTPILNPPQSGILGMHKTQQRPMAENGQVVIRPMMYVALSYDHRIVDGREAVTFLVTVKEALEDPSRMLLGI